MESGSVPLPACLIFVENDSCWHPHPQCYDTAACIVATDPRLSNVCVAEQILKQQNGVRVVPDWLHPLLQNYVCTRRAYKHMAGKFSFNLVWITKASSLAWLLNLYGRKGEVSRVDTSSVIEGTSTRPSSSTSEPPAGINTPCRLIIWLQWGRIFGQVVWQIGW